MRELVLASGISRPKWVETKDVFDVGKHRSSRRDLNTP